MTDTFSSRYRITGGMSLKDDGVDPTSAVCSSLETNFGTVVIDFTLGMIRIKDNFRVRSDFGSCVAQPPRRLPC